jgi:hypothetical protein
MPSLFQIGRDVRAVEHGLSGPEARHATAERSVRRRRSIAPISAKPPISVPADVKLPASTEPATDPPINSAWALGRKDRTGDVHAAHAQIIRLIEIEDDLIGHKRTEVDVCIIAERGRSWTYRPSTMRAPSQNEDRLPEG